MSFLLYAAIWISLLAAGVAILRAVRRPQTVTVFAISATVLSIVLWAASWFLARPDTSVSPISLAGWQWFIDGTAWRLTGSVLLLLLVAAVRAATQGARPLASDTSSGFVLATGFTLAAATLPVVWAADARTELLAIAVFAVVWAAMWWTALPGRPREKLRAVRRLVAPLSLLWFAGAYPPAHSIAVMLAVLPLLGVWPLDGKSAEASRVNSGAQVIQAMPVIAGAAVLARALGGLSDAAVVLGTGLGLLSILVGLARSWSSASLERLATASGPVLAGLLLTGTVWLGGGVIPVTTRLVVFVPILLRLSDDLSPVLRRAALIAVCLASGGLPLLAGFPALSGLYGAWGQGAGWVSVILLIALLSLWLAAMMTLSPKPTAGRPAQTPGPYWIVALPLVLAGLGLFSFDINIGVATPLLVWMVVPVPLLGGFLLSRIAPGVAEMAGDVRESVAFHSLLGPVTRQLGLFAAFVTDAFADAAAILEGDNGLIFLFGLLLLLLWIT